MSFPCLDKGLVSFKQQNEWNDFNAFLSDKALTGMKLTQFLFLQKRFFFLTEMNKSSETLDLWKIR
jgi:hypothetical protein